MTFFWRMLLVVLLVFPTLPIVYFVEIDACKPKKNIIVGVTLPWEGQRDGAVLAAVERYRKEMKYVCLLLLAATVPMLFVRSTGVYMTLLMMWVVALCVVIMIPYVRCNKALRKIKEERGWRRDAEDAPRVVTDLKVAAEEMRWLSPWWFLPPFIISLAPLAFDRSLWWLWALDAAIVPVCYLIYRYLYRNRAEVVDENSDRTLALTRIRRYNWGKCWILMAWATGFFNVGLWLTVEHIWWCMAVVLAYGVAVCVAVVGIEFRVRHLQEKLTADSAYYVDEDDRWIWGMFYYNPNDTKMFINDRVGMGATVNMARRPAQIMMGLCLALVLACPLFGVWMIGMERAPVELEVTEDAVVASHYGGHWNVALADIAEVELISERPRLFRVAGTGMESALTGQFNADGWGRVTCCIDPRTGPWLRITTTDGKIFLFGASREGAAEAAAATLE